MQKIGNQCFPVIIILSVILIIVSSQSAFAQHKKHYISIVAGITCVPDYGSEDDYVPAENDFPVTPPHFPFTFGLSYTYFFTRSIGAGVDYRHFGSNKLILEDPVGKDELEMKSLSHSSLTANFVYRNPRKRFSDYVFAGIGIDTVPASREEILRTKIGYEVILAAAPGTSDFQFNAGVGFEYLITAKIGAKMDIRYAYILAKPDNVHSLQFTWGSFMLF